MIEDIAKQLLGFLELEVMIRVSDSDSTFNYALLDIYDNELET